MRNTRWRGARPLPCMNDLPFLGDSYEAALLLRARVDALLLRLGLIRDTAGRPPLTGK
jgi:hypothetical protein